tara:strand:- start:84 stop:392 length:309 start_codon:yes stop_codon:yes gene_type:complete
MGAEPVTTAIQAAKVAYAIYQATKQSDGSKGAPIQRQDLLSQLQSQKGWQNLRPTANENIVLAGGRKLIPGESIDSLAKILKSKEVSVEDALKKRLKDILRA